MVKIAALQIQRLWMWVLPRVSGR